MLRVSVWHSECVVFQWLGVSNSISPKGSMRSLILWPELANLKQDMDRL